AGGGEREVRVPSIVGVATRGDQPAPFEAAQRPAQVPAIDPERRRDAARRRSFAVRELVEDADLGERELAAEVCRAERTEVTRVEAVEAADVLGPLVDRAHDSVPMMDGSGCG